MPVDIYFTYNETVYTGLTKKVIKENEAVYLVSIDSPELIQKFGKDHEIKVTALGDYLNPDIERTELERLHNAIYLAIINIEINSRLS